MSLSVVIITKNEEQLIADCIRSVSFADEVVVVDSESTDKTVSIAEKLGARVFSKKFTTYAHQRTAALNYVKGTWVLYIDADERVSDELKHEILRVTADRKSATVKSAYIIARKNFYLGTYEWPKIEYLERLFLKEHIVRWEGDVHEHAIHKGDIGTIDHPILHYTHRSLELMTEKTNIWGDVESDMLIKANHPSMNELRFIRIMVTKFLDSYIKQSGWKIGTAGLIESMYQAYSYFIIYAKLWEKQNKLKTKN